MTPRPALLFSASLFALAAAPGLALAAQAGAGVAPVVVTATPLGGTAATIVETVDHDQIVQQGGSNLVDALANVPGVASTSFAAGAGRPVIRGMDANRVKILEDGLSSSDVSDIGPDHGVPIDPLAAQRIEVVRGAATLRYGSQAIGGVVNAINNRIPTMLPDKDFSGEATAAYGSSADSHEGSAQIDAKAGQVAFHADGFARRAGNYDTPLGEQQNSFSRATGFALGGSAFSQGGSRAGLAVTHMDSKYGIPSDDTYIDMKQTKVMGGSSFKLGAGPLDTANLDASYADYQHSEKEQDGTILTTFKNKEFDGRFETLLGQIGPLSSSAIGVQAQDRKFSAIGEDSSYLFPTHTRSGALFAFTEAPLAQNLRLQAAGRIERVKIDGTPASDVDTTRHFTPLSASAGLIFDPSPAIKLGLTLTTAARAPAQTELFARGAHDGPQTFETGDPTLKIERANSIEGTIRANFAAVRLEGSVWGAFYNNYIYGRLTGRTCNDDGDCVDGDSEELRELDYAQRDANFWGAEAKAAIPLAKAGSGVLEANLLGDYVRAKFSNGGGDVPRIPPYRVGAGLAWSSEQLDASFMVIGVGHQDHFGEGDTPTKGYGVLDAQVAWRPLTSHPGIELALVGHNLTDSVERNAVALNKDLVVLPGRDVRMVLRAAF